MALADFFNFRRKKEEGKEPTPQEKKITAGGQITSSQSTLITVQPKRFDLDLSQYKRAIRAAENMDYTSRTRLYDMYEDALMDTHLLSVLGKRRNAVRRTRIEFLREGVPDEKITANIRSPWFNRFIGDILDTQFWGFSLVQFTTAEDGYIDYFCVPRKHVDPQLHLIKRHQSDTLGVPFDEYPGLLMIQGEHRLGILAACLPWVIRKNGTIGDWCQFSELFGMPVRDYSYDASDEQARLKTYADAMMQGSGSVYIHPDGTKLSFIEAGNKSGSAEVYDKLVDVCNAELSKAVLGNTLTTEASETGTQALGTVHKKEEEGVADADRLFILEVLNYNMTDIFAALGMDTTGGEFVFAQEKSSPMEKAQLLAKARNELQLPIDDDYIYSELGIEKPKEYDRMKRESEGMINERQTVVLPHSGKEALRNSHSFFEEAPDYRALNW